MILNRSIPQSRINLIGLLLIIAFILIFIITGLIYYLNNISPQGQFKNTSKKIAGITQSDPTVNRYLDQLNNTKLSKKERYNALDNILFYFGIQYTQTHSPDVRNYVAKDLKEFAKKNFPEYYVEENFNIPCSDPVCGQKITPEFQSFIDQIQKGKLPEYMKSTILLNLKTVAYMPVKDKNNATIGLELVIGDLEASGDKQASDTAKLIKNYLLKTYSIDYEKNTSQ